MAARTLKFHKTSPFKTTQTTQFCRVINVDNYALSQICSLSPAALRVIVYLMSHVEADGSVRCPIQELRKVTSHPVATLSRAFKELHQKELVAKGGRLGYYWLSNRVITPLSIHIQ